MDVAVITVMHDGLLRVSEGAALTWGDIQPQPDGAGLMTIRWSKTDASGEGVLLYLGEEAMQALRAIRPEPAAPDVPVFGLQPAAIAARIRAADGSRPRWWAGTPRGQRRGGGPLSHQRIASVRVRRFRFLDNQAYSGQNYFCSSVLVFGHATLGRSKGVITQAPPQRPAGR